MSPDVGDEITRWLRRLTISTFVLYLLLAGAAGLSWWYLHVEEARTTTALCSLRHDLEQRAASSEVFLLKHPHGIPGIGAATIRDGISKEHATIDSLSGLRCEP